jgi:hypothetical protein
MAVSSTPRSKSSKLRRKEVFEPGGYEAEDFVGEEVAACWAVVEGTTRGPRSEERGKDIGEGEWMKESMLGVWTTDAGVGGTEGPEGRRGKSSFENWDWMSPKEREVCIGSRVARDSHNAGDSGRGEKADLWGVV